MPEIHNPKRRNLLSESRLLSEFLAEEYKGRTFTLQFRVGGYPLGIDVDQLDDAERRVLRNFNRWVDCVVHPPPELVVIEAAMWNAVAKTAQLEAYLLLLPSTPGYDQWRGAPLVPLILTAQHDPIAEELCRRRGFRYVFREPAWIADFYALYPHRRRRSPPAEFLAIPPQTALL